MNNKTLVGINVVLIIAVIVLFVLHFMGVNTADNGVSSIEDPQEVVEDTTVIPVIDTSDVELPEFTRGLKIAFVNSDSLQTRYDYYTDAAISIEADFKRKEASMNRKQGDFMKRRDKFVQEVNMGIVGDAEIQRVSQDLEAEQIKLAQSAQSLQMEFEKSKYDITVEVINQTAIYLDKIGTELGYDYVLTYSRVNSGVLYTNPELDITDYVLKELNKAYAAKEK